MLLQGLKNNNGSVGKLYNKLSIWIKQTDFEFITCRFEFLSPAYMWLNMAAPVVPDGTNSELVINAHPIYRDNPPFVAPLPYVNYFITP